MKSSLPWSNYHRRIEVEKVYDNTTARIVINCIQTYIPKDIEATRYCQHTGAP